MSKKIVFAFLLLIIFAGVFYFLNKTPQSVAQSAGNTYYIATNGSNFIGDGSENNPWQTLRYSFTRMSGGDTLVIKDGIYTGIENSITYRYYPPHGSANAWTIIKAEHDGEAIFDGEYTNPMFSINTTQVHNRYWQVEGTVYTNTSSSNILLTNSSYVKLLRIGAYNTTGGGPNFSIGRGCEYILVEGCYAFGRNGRYKFSTYRSSHVVFRNCVARMDDGPNYEDNIGNFSIYSGSDIEVQNSIAIDSDTEDYWVTRGERHGSFFTPATSAPTHRVNFTKCIALNGQVGGAVTSANWVAYDVTYRDCIFWNVRSSLTGYIHNIRGDRTEFYNCTFGLGETSSSFMRSRGPDTLVKNSIIYGVASSQIFNAVEVYNYNNYYGNSASQIFGTHDKGLNPIYNSSTNPTGALKYITKIENNSNLSGQGESGADIGANLTKMMGKPGTLWGEAGYNEKQEINMWPFPNEDLIKRKMKTYSEVGVIGNRGFAADGNGLYGGPITLTSYIWEYLGNPCPPEICSYGSTPLPPSDTTPPIRSNSQPTGSLAAGTISTTLSLSTNENATCKYSSLSGINYSAMTSNFSTTGSVNHSIIISGLQNGQSYNYYVRCIDTKNNINPDDFVISFNVVQSANLPFPTSNTYYIRPAGGNYASENGSSYNNAWDGYSNINWNTLSANLPVTLYVCGNQTSQLTVRAGGTGENSRLTIRGDCPNDPAMLNGGGTAIYGIYVEGYDYVTIKEFNITRFERGIGFRQWADYGIIENNKTDLNTKWGIYAATNRFTIIQNNICSNTVDQHGIYLANESDDAIIRGNICFGNGRTGIQLNGDGYIQERALVEKNIIYGNVSSLGLSCVHDSVIRNNLVYNAPTKGIVLWDTDLGIGYGCENNQIINNTIHVSSGVNREGILIWRYSTGNTIANNIIYTYNTPAIVVDNLSMIGMVMRNNQYYNTASNQIEWAGQSYSLASFKSTIGQDLNSKTGDPLFVNMSLGDFHLQAGSPSLDAGASANAPIDDLEGNVRPQGFANDMGAYEYQSITAIPNITLVKSADKNEAQSGDILIYTLTYQNTSSGAARNIVITDPIPQGTIYVLGSATVGGVYDAANSRITWTIPSLAGGAAGAVSFQVRVE